VGGATRNTFTPCSSSSSSSSGSSRSPTTLQPTARQTSYQHMTVNCMDKLLR
jgi:hypothetical protein